jgi:hypothetical protein
MKLHSLYYSHSKNGKRTWLMTDTLRKCENLKKAREQNVQGFHFIEDAKPEQSTGRRKGYGTTGYISKNGWENHT